MYKPHEGLYILYILVREGKSPSLADTWTFVAGQKEHVASRVTGKDQLVATHCSPWLTLLREFLWTGLPLPDVQPRGDQVYPEN